MGLFDFFKDGDNYEGTHNSRRSSGKKALDASKFEGFDSNEELIDWMGKNKLILLSEDEGLVVYTNDKEENFLQLYSSTAEVKDEELNEYVEVTGEDLRDLLEEMPDISHFVLNPMSSSILIRREEMLGMSGSVISKPVERGHKKTAGDSRVHDMTSERSGKPSVLTEAESLSDTKNDLVDEMHGDGVSETEKPVSKEDEIESVSEKAVSAASEDKGEANGDSKESQDDEKDEENEEKEQMDLKAAATIPQSIITSALSLAKDGVQKLYLAQENQGDFSSLLLLAATEKELKSEDELIGVKFLHQDGSEEAQALEDDEFLIYDKEAAEQLAKNYSEETALYYFRNHPVIYVPLIQKNENGESEILAFSDFSHVPELFGNAVEGFEIAPLEKFDTFLENEWGRIDFVRLNPFSASLFIKPEAFRPVTASPKPEVVVPDELTVTAADKKAAVAEVLGLLKDFDIASITLAEDDKVSFTFRNKQDGAVALQILRMKTDLKI